MDFVLRSTGKAMGDHGIIWGGKTLLDLDYADNLSIIDENVSKMNELLEVLRVQDARIGLKINFKKTKFTMTLVTKKLISWAASLTLVVILVKTVGAVKRLKVE